MSAFSTNNIIPERPLFNSSAYTDNASCSDAMQSDEIENRGEAMETEIHAVHTDEARTFESEFEEISASTLEPVHSDPLVKDNDQYEIEQLVESLWELFPEMEQEGNHDSLTTTDPTLGYGQQPGQSEAAIPTTTWVDAYLNVEPPSKNSVDANSGRAEATLSESLGASPQLLIRLIHEEDEY